MASKKSARASKSGKGVDAAHAAVEPSLHQQTGSGSHETQRFGEIVPMPHGLSAKVAKQSVALLNQTLADSITLRDMYKKHHWQVVGPAYRRVAPALRQTRGADQIDRHDRQQIQACSAQHRWRWPPTSPRKRRSRARRADASRRRYSCHD